MQSSKPDLWRFFRPEPGRSDLSKDDQHFKMNARQITSAAVAQFVAGDLLDSCLSFLTKPFVFWFEMFPFDPYPGRSPAPVAGHIL